VFSAPPGRQLLDQALVDRVQHARPRPETELAKGVVRRARVNLAIGALGLQRPSDDRVAGNVEGPPDPPLRERCAGRTPKPEIHVGHLAVDGAPIRSSRSGVRDARARIAGLAGEIAARTPTLEGCYRRALASCASEARVVVMIEIDRRGQVSPVRASAALAPAPLASPLAACVEARVGRWRFKATDDVARVRVPLIFRFAGSRVYSRGVGWL
jgi:hypothetical protein